MLEHRAIFTFALPQAKGSKQRSIYSANGYMSLSSPANAPMITLAKSVNLSDFNLCKRQAWGDPCHAHASCAWDYKKPAVVTCKCVGTWDGDGRTCIDKGACVHPRPPCFKGVTCFESKLEKKGYYCGVCPDGYAGDGEVCGDIDACLDKPCAPDVKCFDHVPPANVKGFTCGKCPVGLIGDGKICQLTPHNAAVLRSDVPHTLYPGQRFTMAITVKNMGTSIWRTNGAFVLGSNLGFSKQCMAVPAKSCFTRAMKNNPFGVNLLMPRQEVKPGETVTMLAAAVAPTEESEYTMEWRMAANHQWFGAGIHSTILVEGAAAVALQAGRDYTTACSGNKRTYSMNTNVQISSMAAAWQKNVRRLGSPWPLPRLGVGAVYAARDP